MENVSLMRRLIIAQSIFFVLVAVNTVYSTALRVGRGGEDIIYAVVRDSILPILELVILYSIMTRGRAARPLIIVSSVLIVAGFGLSGLAILALSGSWQISLLASYAAIVLVIFLFRAWQIRMLDLAKKNNQAQSGQAGPVNKRLGLLIVLVTALAMIAFQVVFADVARNTEIKNIEAQEQQFQEQIKAEEAQIEQQRLQDEAELRVFEELKKTTPTAVAVNPAEKTLTMKLCAWFWTDLTHTEKKCHMSYDDLLQFEYVLPGSNEKIPGLVRVTQVGLEGGGSISAPTGTTITILGKKISPEAEGPQPQIESQIFVLDQSREVTLTIE